MGMTKSEQQAFSKIEGARVVLPGQPFLHGESLWRFLSCGFCHGSGEVQRCLWGKNALALFCACPSRYPDKQRFSF